MTSHISPAGIAIPLKKLATSVGRLVSLGSLIASDPTARPDVNINFHPELERAIQSVHVTDRLTLAGMRIDWSRLFTSGRMPDLVIRKKRDVGFYWQEPVSLS